MQEKDKIYFNDLFHKYEIYLEDFYFLKSEENQEDDLNKFSIIVNLLILNKEKYKEFLEYISKNFDIETTQLSEFLILICIKYNEI